MKRRLLIITLFILPVCVSAQEYNTSGCLLEDEVYEQLPQQVHLLTRDYVYLPKRYSLEKYCPTPEEQLNYATCVGWAAAYAAHTIAEAAAYGWTDKEKINQEAFSPLFVYLESTGAYNNCEEGIVISTALRVLKNEGVVKYNLFNAKCSSFIPEAIRVNARKYKIDDYIPLFSLSSSYDEKIRMTKKALSENKPIVISTNYYGGFHAMCAVGYDDDRNGGSFLLMNSWGIRWKNNGFDWITYDDYYKHVRYAYEIHVRKKVTPPPAPKPKPPIITETPVIAEIYNLKGEIHFNLETGDKKEMRPKLYTGNQISYYRMSESYLSGTNFRIYIYNNEPAYVYVIGSDLQNSVDLVFPPNDKISPALIYRANDIAIPDEGQPPFQMDNIIGTDYVCLLYSIKPLLIHSIVEKIKTAPGNFYDKVKIALFDDLVPAKKINYKQNVIRFDVRGTNKTVVPVIVEIMHK